MSGDPDVCAHIPFGIYLRKVMVLLRLVLLLVATAREFGPGCPHWLHERQGLMGCLREAASQPW